MYLKVAAVKEMLARANRKVRQKLFYNTAWYGIIKYVNINLKC